MGYWNLIFFYLCAKTLNMNSWDMDYKSDLGFRPSILLDKKGEQIVSFKTGTHTIAVKVVNENGLEAIEIIRFSV